MRATLEAASPPPMRGKARRASSSRAARSCRGAQLMGAAALATLLPVDAAGQTDDADEVSGAEVAAAAAPADARPAGPWVVFEDRPRPTSLRACSTTTPVCVDARRAEAPVLETLAAFERAFRGVTFALRLPGPDPDPDTLRYEVHLEPGVADVTGDAYETVPFARDPRSRVDRVLSFVRIDDRVREGCTLDAAAARALVRGAMLRAVPAATEGVARAHVAYLAGLVVPCSAAALAAEVSAFQGAPERAACDGRSGERAPSADDPTAVRPDDVPSRHVGARYANGAALWWSRLDWAYGRQPGDVVRAAWALTPTMTDPSAARWNDEPDVFDVLRKTFRGALSTGSTFADVALDVAVARAFVGTAGIGAHQPELAVHDASARVPVWETPWPREPKRLSPRAPVAPTGATYIAVSTDGAKEGAGLRVEITWEEHALFRWALVKVDATGHEVGRVVVPTQARAREAQMSLVAIDPARVHHVLLVGTNAGDPSYAFDPDEEAWEPHGVLVTIAAE